MSEWIPIADAKIEFGKRYEATWKDGVVSVICSSSATEDRVIAVREYNPDPYVPPKPKRMTCMLAGMDMREVLPGDPDPDRVIEAIAEMRKYQTGDMNYWADKLEGKNE